MNVWSQRRSRSVGFTLIEVLVVVAIIALLVAVLLPSLSAARDSTRRTICRTNQRTMSQAFSFYAEDTKQNYFFFNETYDFASGRYDSQINGLGAGTVGDDSAVAWAVDTRFTTPGSNAGSVKGAPSKRYLRDWNALLCPGTHNRIEKLSDLNNNADCPSDEVRLGHSYEFWNGFQKNTFAPRGPINGKMYSSSQDDADHDGFPDCLKRPKLLARLQASRIILVVDGDDPTPSDAGSDHNNFPDSPFDNHGSKGWNMLFGDLHSAWITPKTTYQTLNRSDMDLSGVPAEYIPQGGPPPG